MDKTVWTDHLMKKQRQKRFFFKKDTVDGLEGFTKEDEN